MARYQVGDFVWAKMTGYPFWPGKIVDEDEYVKKPKGKSEMHYIRFYGTGDHAWTKAEFIKAYKEHKDALSVTNKRPNFLDAVKEIEHAFERRNKGLPDASDEESDSNSSDDEPLSKRARIGSKTPLAKSQETKAVVKRKKLPLKKANHPTREEVS